MQAWIDARRRHHLSHVQVQMARELGMNPKKLGQKDNHDQEPWKMPLGQFIEDLYRRRFGKERPESVLSIEERVRCDAEEKARRRAEKARRRETQAEEHGDRCADGHVIEHDLAPKGVHRFGGVVRRREAELGLIPG
jgi:hypothetical protein